MKKVFVAISLILGLSVSAQENVAEQRVINKTFTGINVSDGISLELTQANVIAVNVSASDKKYLDKLKTEVVNGILVISVPQKKWTNTDYKNRKLKVKVSLPKLTSLQINDGCSVKNTNTFNEETINIVCKDGSSADLEDFNATTLNATVKDGSSVVLTGKSTTLNIVVNDGSSFKANEFVTEFCNADVNDGSSVKINVTKELTAVAHDGSSIRYEGSPTIKKSSAKDGSSIKKS